MLDTKAVWVLRKAAEAEEPDPMDALQQRMDVGMAQAAQEYEQARNEQAAHHGNMVQRDAELRAQIAKLDPQVAQVVDGKVDKAGAQAALDYLQAHADLRGVQEARRMAFPATQPPEKGSEGGDG